MSILATKTLRDLRRQRWQYLAVVFTIFLGNMLFGASYDAYQNLKLSYQRMFDELRFADVTISGGDTQAIASSLRETEGVEAVDTRIVADIPFQVGDSGKFVGRIVSLPEGQQPDVNQVQVLSGTYLPENALDQALIEQHLADHYQLAVGDQVQVHGSEGWTALTIVGVVATPEYLWPARSRQDVLPAPGEFGVLFVPESVAGSLAGDAAVSQVVVYFNEEARGPALEQQVATIAEAAGATDVVTRAEQPSNAALSLDIQGFNELSIMFPVLFLTAAGMAAFVLLSRVVSAQRSQIGMLLANGFSSRTVMLHYLSYGLVVSLAGAVPGVIAGMALARWVTRLYTSEIDVPTVVIKLHPLTPVLGLAAGIAIGVVATLVPAFAAGRLSPAAAMRGIAPLGRGGVSLAERVLPPLRRLPSRWKMTLRGIGRSKRRSLSTVIGVVLALTLVLVSWGMLDTTQILLNRQFDEIERQDATVWFTPDAGKDRITVVKSVEGVAAVDPMERVAVTLSNGSDQYATELVGLPADTTLHVFVGTNGDHLQLPDQGILVGQALHDQLGVSKGDTLEITVPSLNISATEPVAGFVDEPLGTYAYISLAELTRLVGTSANATGALDQVPNAALVAFVPGSDFDAIRTSLAGLPIVGAVQDAHALQDAAQTFMGLFYSFVGLMLVFGGLLAFALIFNMMSANIAERSAEIAALRASGARRRYIWKLLLSENLLLTTLSLVPGLIIGYVVAWLFMNSFSSDLFQFSLEMRTSTLILSALAILLVTLVSQVPGLRAADRLDLGRVVRERAT